MTALALAGTYNSLPRLTTHPACEVRGHLWCVRDRLMGEVMARQIRVLIVDDSAAALTAMRKALEGAGYAVRTAKSIEEAVSAVTGAELVIVDFHMPGEDGGSGLSRLKAAADSAGSRAKFYLHTSDPIEGANHGRYGFDGLLLYKGNLPRLVSQLDAIRPK